MNLNPARLPGESFADYKTRRAAGNRRPVMGLRHVSTEIVLLPAKGVDAEVDRAVIRGDYRDLVLVTLPDGRQMRRGRTKGVTRNVASVIPGAKRTMRWALRNGEWA